MISKVKGAETQTRTINIFFEAHSQNHFPITWEACRAITCRFGGYFKPNRWWRSSSIDCSTILSPLLSRTKPVVTLMGKSHTAFPCHIVYFVVNDWQCLLVEAPSFTFQTQISSYDQAKRTSNFLTPTCNPCDATGSRGLNEPFEKLPELLRRTVVHQRNTVTFP